MKPSTFRKAVATLIEREAGSLAASRHLDHSSDEVTKRYYIERDKAAGDNRTVLDRFRE